MARIKEETVYQFDELSDRAKETARDWWRQCEDQDSDTSCVFEDVARMADLIGIDLRTRTAKLMGGGTRMEPCIYYSGFSSQGDGACFEGTYEYKKGSVQAIAKEAPAKDEKGYEQNNRLNQIARDLAEVQRPYFYKLTANVTHRGHYSHEMCTDIAVYWKDDDAPEEVADKVREYLRDFMRWIYRSLEAEYEYRMSDENVDESIRMNEYEFDEDGHIA